MKVEGPASDERLVALVSRLEAARDLSTERIATEIREVGFRCLRCGECCRGEDNSVTVFPSEIRRIVCKTGKSWLEVVEPPPQGEWDSKGNFHTLEWRLRKEGPGCCYYSDCRCSIYPDRPLLCRTYPFYLEDGDLHVSECRGLGKAIEHRAALRLASVIKTRYLTEIEESIELVRRYRDFERGRPSPEGEGVCIVHDSEGEHPIGWDRIPDHLRRCLRGE